MAYGSYVLLAMLLLWTYQSCKYNWFRGVKNLEFTPRMSVIWWFIPLGNIIQIPRILIEIHKANQPLEEWKNAKTFILIPIWWISFIVYKFLAVFLLNENQPKTPEELYNGLISLSWVLLSAITFTSLTIVMIVKLKKTRNLTKNDN
jgi:hypothetical protein